MLRLINFAFIYIFLFIQNIVSAQYSCTCKGVVKNQHGENIPGAVIRVKNSNKVYLCDENGSFHIHDLPEGEHELEASSLGMMPVIKKIVLKANKTHTCDFTCHTSTKELEEVAVQAQSSTDKLKQQPFNISSLETRKLQLQAASLSDQLGRVSGVMVRQDGGMGSQANINLNGISGKGIQYFVNGVPMSIYGQGMQLQNISVNLIDRLEIFKGVTPVHLGADALGGAINLVTKDIKTDYLDASAMYGSWNTYQATLNARKIVSEHFNLGLSGYHNHSDNNYYMDNKPVPIDALGNVAPRRIRRFNDEYTASQIQADAEIVKLKWADKIAFTSIYSQGYKQYQHGISAVSAWGGVFGNDQGFNNIFTYQKDSIAKKLDIHFAAGYSINQRSFNDNAARRYFWDGTYTEANTILSETSLATFGRNPIYTDKTVFARLNMNYRLHSNHSINVNLLPSSTQRSGTDELGKQSFSGRDPLANGNSYTKFFAGLAWQSEWFNKRLINIVSIKNYYFQSEGNELGLTFVGKRTQNSRNDVGFSNAIKYIFSEKIVGKISYENAIRQPDVTEIFGDYVLVSPNFKLNPEQSHNINIGGILSNKQQNHFLQFEFNGFYRRTQNQIFLSGLGGGQAVNLNLLTTQTLGAEAEVRYKPFNALGFTVNATYQDIRLLESDPLSNVPDRYIGARLPNIPYLFGNFSTDYTMENVFMKGSKVNFYYYMNYLHNFFLAWEVDGLQSSKNLIESQLLHHTGISYIFPKQRFSISVECRNLTDTPAFDNFSVQKPGRSLFVKVRFFISKQ